MVGILLWNKQIKPKNSKIKYNSKIKHKKTKSKNIIIMMMIIIMCCRIDDLVHISYFNRHDLIIKLLKMFQPLCKFQVVKMLSWKDNKKYHCYYYYHYYYYIVLNSIWQICYIHIYKKGKKQRKKKETKICYVYFQECVDLTVAESGSMSFHSDRRWKFGLWWQRKIGFWCMLRK